MEKFCEIHQSSLIDQTVYDPNEQSLIVIFHSKEEDIDGPMYKYVGMSMDEYKLFENAESKGKHFCSNIRKNPKYNTIKLSTTPLNNVLS